MARTKFTTTIDSFETLDGQPAVLITCDCATHVGYGAAHELDELLDGEYVPTEEGAQQAVEAESERLRAAALSR